MPSRRLAVRGFVVFVALVIAITGVVGKGVLFGSAPAARAVVCDTNLTLSPGAGGHNNLIQLGDGLKGAAYATETITVSGGNGTDYFWQITNGTLPPGLTLESAGTSGHDDTTDTISGTPTAAGDYTVNLSVTDWPNYPANRPDPCPAGDSENYKITVHASGHVTIVIDLQPDSGVNFPFGGDLGPFVLDDDSSGSPPKQQTFVVLPGFYDVIQGDPPNSGYELTAINCTTGQVYDLPNRKMTINVQNDGNYTCTFVNVFRRSDLKIAKVEPGPYKGNNIYSTRPLPTQTQSRLHVPKGTYSYFVRFENDGPGNDNFRVKGTAQGSPKFTVKYFVNASDVSTQVRAGLYETGDLLTGQYVEMEVRVTELTGAPAGAKKTVLVSAGSVKRLDQVDMVRAITGR